MPFIFILAWRNLRRSPLRSLALLMSIALGVGAGLLSMGFVQGLIEQRFINIIQSETTHVQVHHPKYRGDKETRYFIQGSNEVEKAILQHPQVKISTSRTIANGIIASAAATSGVEIIGIVPEEENAISGFAGKVIEGTYFEEQMRNPVIVGRKLANKLNLRLKSRVVLSFQDVEGNIVSAAFRIAGIYRTHNASLDEMRVYVMRSDLQENIAGERPIHEISVLLFDHETASSLANTLQAQFTHLEVLPWEKLSVELKYLLDQGAVSMYIFLFIIMLGLGFGILNTMLMVVFERTRELGMLMALGMKKPRVFAMIIYETIYIGVVGTLLGCAIGAFATNYFAKNGLNMGEGLAEFGYDPITYPVLNGSEYINVSIMVFVMALLAALYPAFKATRLLPAEAVKA